MSREWLSNSDILIVSKPLAKAVGVGASIALRRVQNWLDYNEQHKVEKEKTHYHDGRWWAYNGYGGWTDDIEVYSRSTVRRIFNHLEELRLLITTNKYNKRKSDQTKWYTIDYEAYDQFIDLWNKCACPLHGDGKPEKQYASFIKAWEALTPAQNEQGIIPLPKMSSTPAHNEQGVCPKRSRGMSKVSRGPLPKMSTALPESLSDYKPEESQKETTTTFDAQSFAVVSKDNASNGSSGENSTAGVFKFFLENISDDIKPLIAEDITDAVEEFGAAYVLEGIKIAVRANKRDWRYIQGVLKQWRDKGRPELITDKPEARTDAKPYTSGKYAWAISTGPDDESPQEESA